MSRDVRFLRKALIDRKVVFQMPIDGYSRMPAQPLDRVQPAAEQSLMHPQVDRMSISRLVRSFYVRAEARLGRILARHIVSDWKPHLEKMLDLWCSVILKADAPQAEGRLRRRLRDMARARETALKLCEPEVATVFIDRAERNAQRLKVGMFVHLPRGDPASRQPTCG